MLLKLYYRNPLFFKQIKAASPLLYIETGIELVLLVHQKKIPLIKRKRSLNPVAVQLVKP